MNKGLPIEDNFGHKVAVFVDARDVYKNGKKYRSGKLNYRKFLEWIVGPNSVVYAGAYVMSGESPDNENKFFDSLRLNGYDVRCKPIHYKEGGNGLKHAKNSWVLGISLDMVRYCSKADTLYLISSNSEFIETLYFLKSAPVRIEVCSIKESTEQQMIKVCTNFSQIPEDCFVETEE